MALKTIEDIDVRGKRVLMRVDFNVPLDSDGAVTDDFRIRSALPSIRSVLARGGRLVLMSHLGRPSGSGHEAAFSLVPVARVLSSLLAEECPDGVSVPADRCIAPGAIEAVAALGDGQALLLENLRFEAGETAGDPEFSERLAAMGDIYCNNAFGTSHRAHASMHGVALAIKPGPCVAGGLVAEEVGFLLDALEDPRRPFVAITGGAKVSDKILALRNLIGRVDTLLVGGAMAYTFMKALGQDVGSSLVEGDRLDEAREIIGLVDASGTDLVLPVDHVCGRELSPDSPVEVHDGGIPDGWMGLDIGPRTTARFTEEIRPAGTVVWNGPLGAFETPPFDVGTRQVAEALAICTDRGGLTVVGGGDTAAAVESAGVTARMQHVSTGGGASLKLLEGSPLVGLEPLEGA